MFSLKKSGMTIPLRGEETDAKMALIKFDPTF